MKSGLANSDVFLPDEFGSAGGGPGGGAGGGRIWFKVANTLHLDGMVSANGQDGKTVGTKVFSWDLP